MVIPICSVAELHRFDAASALGKNFDSAAASPYFAASQLFSTVQKLTIGLWDCLFL
jgi:hypothetical protein